MVPFEAAEAAQTAPTVNLDNIGGAPAQPAPAANDNAADEGEAATGTN